MFHKMSQNIRKKDEIIKDIRDNAPTYYDNEGKSTRWIDGLALMMTSEITTNRQEIKNMREELEKSRLKNERSQRAWKAMEESLGVEIREYNDKVDKLLDAMKPLRN